ncbi:uncharacterized protein LOC135344412 [Halichondria panicea]|uniref:uncharacterized protein LOC135344412 n=1 Tax=Halichondria panicea TaxID=6063 RepID=UPI00312B717B
MWRRTLVLYLVEESLNGQGLALTVQQMELSINISSTMNGQTVQCFRDGPLDTIGNHTLRVADPPPPPTSLVVTDVGLSTFTLTWEKPTSDCGTSFSYDVVSDCGGSCSSMSGVCSDWTAAGQNCSVMVRAALCTGQPGSFSTPVMLSLTEPPPPLASDVSGQVVYSGDSLDSLTITFPTVSPVDVAPALSPVVTYFVQTVGDPQGVSCNATLCQYQTIFARDSLPSNDLNVTVTVSNGIGSGRSVTPFKLPASISSLVTVTVVIVGSNASVSAHLPDPSSFQDLAVTAGVCNTSTWMSANGMARDTLTVTLTSIQPETNYCYSIHFNQGGLTFDVMGTFRSTLIVPTWVIVVTVCVVIFFAVGIIVGILLTLFCRICVHGIQQRKCGTLLLVILLIIVFGLGIGILIGYCCVKNKKGTLCTHTTGLPSYYSEKDGKEHLESQEINPPPVDSLYADPNTIEHQSAPGTEDQYAMVDRKVKKNTKPKPTPPEALYQDPNKIEHETAASGDTYAVVDKAKKSSKKEGGPDVVPPASEGLTYALSSKRPKPGSGRQAPQQPGEYPKEHPVEY